MCLQVKGKGKGQTLMIIDGAHKEYDERAVSKPQAHSLAWERRASISVTAERREGVSSYTNK